MSRLDDIRYTTTSVWLTSRRNASILPILMYACVSAYYTYIPSSPRESSPISTTGATLSPHRIFRCHLQLFLSVIQTQARHRNMCASMVSLYVSCKCVKRRKSRRRSISPCESYSKVTLNVKSLLYTIIVLKLWNVFPIFFSERDFCLFSTESLHS